MREMPPPVWNVGNGTFRSPCAENTATSSAPLPARQAASWHRKPQFLQSSSAQLCCAPTALLPGDRCMVTADTKR